MAETAEYKVRLDPDKARELGRIWGQESPEKLIQSLFELAYHHYVEEEDELVSGKAMRRRTYELEAEVESLKKRLSARSPGEKESTLCPKCYSKVRYDAISRDYACEMCGWEGPPEEVVRHPRTPRSS